jgi:hypothetical protein
MNLTELAGHIAKLDLIELKALNTYVVGQINTQEGRTGIGARGSYKVGDLVDFDYQGKTVRANVVGINRKSISCEEVSKPYVGKSGKWRVAPSFLRLVGADKAVLGLPATPAAEETEEAVPEDIPFAPSTSPTASVLSGTW